MYRNWYWSWNFRSCHMASEAIRVIPCSKVKKMFSLITSMFFPKWFWTFPFGRQNPRDKFISICLQQRECKQFIGFQLLSTNFTFQSFWRFHLAPSPQKTETSVGPNTYPSWRPRCGVVHVASQITTERHAVRPLRGHPKARGAWRRVTRRVSVTPMIRWFFPFVSVVWYIYLYLA